MASQRRFDKQQFILFINYPEIIFPLKQSPAAHWIHLPAGRRAGASAHTTRNAAQRTELAAGQLSRYHHKRPMASKFVEYKPNALSRMGCNVGGLLQA